ncbi:hypothetical protein Dtox_3108 [Desulfofarcimen acetoxidans DSM 771]|jgi:hypothetical protein|uniref:Uncharacterized protein n=1 Tax=Desulfofarcimen acetoxidans (strain ATCC 49208 / DSM 771 / KCTC 5769 / VKM B-1644 / 5575) TaxID=485916 RepID=C8W4H4_DESAS|nr:hypothetical protein Dtox_3108 [Desulfofarcimen acetoxidans DSM 771]
MTAAIKLLSEQLINNKIYGFRFCGNRFIRSFMQIRGIIK